MADSTARKQRGRPFEPGESGNPKGRPKGSRNKLGEQFLSDLAADWEEHGLEAIRATREEKPAEYVKVVAGLLPKELLVRKDPLNDMSDEEIADALDILRGLVAESGGGAHRPTHGTSGKA